MQASAVPVRRTLEFGIYRDGDNNLDPIQESVVSQAVKASAHDDRIQFTVEDTTATRPGAMRQAPDDARPELRTDQFTIAHGRTSRIESTAPQEMSEPKTLAAFVTRTLDNAEVSGAKQTWIELVDHGGGDGGGLQTSDGHVMPMPQIAGAIAEGVAMHARTHPEDASRGVDGVVANQCLMATMGFTDALARAGVRYLAASPETMVAPGVPSDVAHAIAENERDPHAMARAIVADVMKTRYDAGPFGAFGGLAPAAAFDVIDCSRAGVDRAEHAIAQLNDDLAASASNAGGRAEIRRDVGGVDGMARIPGGDALPWRADRPAIAVYDCLAGDARLGDSTRADARAAAQSVRRLVLAHEESSHFDPFAGASYRDAAGPTVHLPLSVKQIDPWAPRIRETGNAFYRAVGAPSLTRAIA